MKRIVPSRWSYLLKSIFYGALGIIIFCIICYTNSYALNELNLKPIFWGNLFSLFWGITIGIFISLAAGIGFGILNGYSFHFKNLFSDFAARLTGNLYPALTEEAFFRGGVVHVISQVFGQTMGLISGSLPFGVLHVIGHFFGQKITYSRIVGISLAGLMLSLFYLRFGLIGAFSCHLMWNSFVPGWEKVYGIENKKIENSIEGSWITCSLLIVVCIGLYFLSSQDT